jgi:hypothetical protein
VSIPGPLPPTPSQPPSAGKLLKSTLIAAAVATLILVTIVLPAEYGVDPTGVGRLLGLKEMGEIKMRLVQEEAAHNAEQAAADSAAAAAQSAAAPPAAATAATAATPAAATKTDVTEVVLPPGQKYEIKLAMKKDAVVTFAWSTNRGVVNYDTHADAPTIDYHGYGKGTGAKADSGSLTAAFDGHHGWFWRNRGGDTVTITLRTTGDYQALKRMP